MLFLLFVVPLPAPEYFHFVRNWELAQHTTLAAFGVEWQKQTKAGQAITFHRRQSSTSSLSRYLVLRGCRTAKNRAIKLNLSPTENLVQISSALLLSKIIFLPEYEFHCHIRGQHDVKVYCLWDDKTCNAHFRRRQFHLHFIVWLLISRDFAETFFCANIKKGHHIFFSKNKQFVIDNLKIDEIHSI